MKSVALGVLLCSSFLWAESPENSSVQQPSELVITNVNVVDTRYGGIIPGATVIVKDGVIQAVAKFGLINAGPQVRVINAGGLYLIPGLWDMDVHLSTQANSGSRQSVLFARYLAYGITGVRDMDQLDRVPAGAELRPEIEPGEPLWSLHRSTPRTSLSIFERRTVEGLEEIRAQCSQISDIGTSPTKGCDPSQARELFLTLSETATWMVPDLISTAIADDDSHSETSSTANYVGLSPPARAELKPQEGVKVTPELQRDLDLVSEMRRSGVQFLTGTSGPRNGLAPGMSLHQELELLVKSGFTPMQALQAATFNAALYMARLDKYGVVERGHYGDLVLLEANPLVDIRHTRKVAAVVLHGTYFSRAELENALQQAEQTADGPMNAAKAVASKPAE